MGNLQTGIALWSDADSAHYWKIASDPSRTPDEYRLLLAGLLESHGLEAPAVAGSVLGCVVPELTPVFAEVLEKLCGGPPLVIGPGVRTGLQIRGEDPREAGADRIANAVAARHRFGSPVVACDFGTALALDVVGSDGDYLGASIAPGIEVAAEALGRRAARLGRVELKPPPRAIAANTIHGLQSGLVFGYVGMVEGLIRRVRDEIGPAPVIATGDGPWLPALLGMTRSIDAYDPLLTLRGLRLIHAHHTGRS